MPQLIVCQERMISGLPQWLISIVSIGLFVELIKNFFYKLDLNLEFADFSSTVLERAVNMQWDDCEDAIQSAKAELVHADYIITRNIKDFSQSKVMAFTPSELLSRI